MNDENLERLLRRYEPVPPSASLRARVVGTHGSRRAWPWAVAAAALVVLTVGLQAASARLLRDVAGAVQPNAQTEEVDALATMMGDADDPGGAARQMIERRDADRALEESLAPVATTGVAR